jgi:hypothetical protein
MDFGRRYGNVTVTVIHKRRQSGRQFRKRFLEVGPVILTFQEESHFDLILPHLDVRTHSTCMFQIQKKYGLKKNPVPIRTISRWLPVNFHLYRPIPKMKPIIVRQRFGTRACGQRVPIQASPIVPVDFACDPPLVNSDLFKVGDRLPQHAQ